jgi:nucleoside-triphosphatase
MNKNILITGRPRVGKTTLIKHAAGILGVRAGGFYTEEIKGEGVRGREGFRIITLDGKEGTLAKVGYRSRFNVGLYGVNLDELEEIGVAAIHNAIKNKDWVVIDEIGKMEEFSLKFKDAVLKALNSTKSFLATVREKDSPYTAAIKKRPDVKIVRLTVPDRERTYEEIKKLIK